MGWLTYSSGNGLVTDISTDKSLRLKVTSGGTTKYLYIKTVTTVTEWSSLTQAAAEAQAVHADHNSDTRAYTDWTPFEGGATFVGIREDGTKKTAQSTRQNDAGAYKLIVRSVVTSSEVA
jgi:hypothetical protein